MARPRSRIEAGDCATNPTITLIRDRRPPSRQIYEVGIALTDDTGKSY
jgi:hypothetical protein